MGHARQIYRHRVAGDVLAEIDRNLHGPGLGLGLLHHLAEPHHLPVGVGHLDTDRVLPRNWCNNADRRYSQGDGEIVSQVGDLGQPQASLKFYFILRDDWPGLNFDNTHLEAKVGEGLLQDPSPFADFGLLFIEGELFRRQQQIKRRQRIVARWIRGEVQFQLLDAAILSRADWHGTQALFGFLVFDLFDLFGLIPFLGLGLGLDVLLLVGFRDGDAATDSDGRTVIGIQLLFVLLIVSVISLSRQPGCPAPLPPGLVGLGLILVSRILGDSLPPQVPKPAGDC